MLTGFLAIFLGFGGFAAWAALTKISGAVIAAGQVVVDSNVKRVQHMQGGIVGRILARNGDHVTAGDVVLALDETLIKTQLAQLNAQLGQWAGRVARLEAERDGQEQLTTPGLMAMLGADGAAVVLAEQRLHLELRATREAQKRQLRERANQFESEIEGLTAQLAAKRREIKLIADELKGVEDLYRKNLVPITRRNALERDAIKLEGEAGVLTSSIAKARGQVTEINLQLMTIDQNALSEALKELRDAQSNVAQLLERRVAAIDQLARVEVRAPQAGIVHESIVHTVGGVVGAGETLMVIVPDGEKLSFEVRVGPGDIDQVRLGQKVMLRLSAFNQRTTPELEGTVSRIGADLSREAQTGLTFFTIRVLVTEAELSKLGTLRLHPGMPVEAFVETGERTAYSYFAKPLTDAFARAFREE
jgi:HlyD family secretion protein